MKVRIGVGMGVASAGAAAAFTQLVDDLDDLGFDSIWLPEVLTAPTLDPLVALAFAAAHNPRVKLGTTMLLPGRNPVRLAKELATLDVLSGGRLLVTFVPGLPRRPETGAAGVAGPDKGAMMDEMLPLLRELWAGEAVTHHGRAGRFRRGDRLADAVQEPLEFWTGGMVPAALRRCGRFADGWLPSTCTPEEVAGRAAGRRGRRGPGRTVDQPRTLRCVARLCPAPALPKAIRAVAVRPPGSRSDRGGPGGDRRAAGHDRGIPRRGVLQVRGPSPVEPPSWRAELESLADGILDLQT